MGNASPSLPEGPLRRRLKTTFDTLDAVLADHRPGLAVREIGTVAEVGSGIVRIIGFTDVADGELVYLPGDVAGMVVDLDRESVGVVLLGANAGLTVGSEVRRSGRVVHVPVGSGLLGRVVDPLGAALDGEGPVASERWMPIERPAPPIIDRAPVDQPLQTGLKAVDAAIPIGRGQRELIVGDRQTGKTTIAIDAILNQRDTGVLCVYCAIAQRGTGVARVLEELRTSGALESAVVVVAAGNDPAGLQYIAPYAATAIAECFMESGHDVLVVYDDLTRHARAYREMSLLLRRPPGREAYPGDIFFIHSRLLERATHLRAEKGGGSLTALPIVETQAQNLAAYIPTNLISITDGQIYLSPDLFRKGHLPAIDIGRSVSRVGGKAQLPAYRAVAGDLRLSYAQFEELETFARFGTRLDVETRRSLDRGARVRAVLRQREHDLLSVPEQLAVLLAATQGLFDDLPADQVATAEATLRQMMRDEMAEIGALLSGGGPLAEAERAALLDAARSRLERLASKPGD